FFSHIQRRPATRLPGCDVYCDATLHWTASDPGFWSDWGPIIKPLETGQSHQGRVRGAVLRPLGVDATLNSYDALLHDDVARRAGYGLNCPSRVRRDPN